MKKGDHALVNPGFIRHTRWIGNPEIKNGLRDFDAILPEICMLEKQNALRPNLQNRCLAGF
jgi:hypothetical protein